MRKKKEFSKTIGNYFFDVNMGYSSITISRENKEEAVHAYVSYVRQKKQCEWLGKWDGKAFVDTAVPKAA
jgi:hypothetical protein